MAKNPPQPEEVADGQPQPQMQDITGTVEELMAMYGEQALTLASCRTKLKEKISEVEELKKQLVEFTKTAMREGE